MKIVLQRINYGSVTVDEKITGKIDKGLLLYVGFGTDDDASKLKPMAEKIVNMRIFENAQGKFHFSVLEVKGGILAVPQFTLFADTKKGRRPEFFGALEPKKAAELFTQFLEVLGSLGPKPVQSGIFGAHMKVAYENDGPVTILVEN